VTSRYCRPWTHQGVFRQKVYRKHLHTLMEPQIAKNREFKLTSKIGIQSERIDRYLASAPGLLVTRSGLNKLFENGSILVNGNIVKKSYKVKDGQEIKVILPPQPDEENRDPENKIKFKTINPTNIPLNIVFEDEFLAVINKDCGLVVHPGEGEDNDQTLVNALIFRYGTTGLSQGENPARPGIVHRLDKDTSGLMIICKNDEIHEKLKQQFQERTKIKKIYHALVVGKMKDEHAVINGNIMRHPKIHHKMTVTNDPNKGKTASTEYTVVKHWQTRNCFYSLLEIQLHTGRTHQIRVHLSSLTHPVVGDVLYHKRNAKHKAEQLCLVAKKLYFEHPKTEDMVALEVEWPQHFREFAEFLDKTSLKQE